MKLPYSLVSHGITAENRRVEKILQVYDSLAEMKTDEYRYWQSRPVYERMEAVTEMTGAAYALKGQAPDVRRLQRVIVCLQRPGR